MRIGSQTFPAQSGKTTPLTVNDGQYAVHLHLHDMLRSGKLVREALVARVNGQLWDLTRPLVDNCSLEYLDFSTPEVRL